MQFYLQISLLSAVLLCSSCKTSPVSHEENTADLQESENLTLAEMLLRDGLEPTERDPNTDYRESRRAWRERAKAYQQSKSDRSKYNLDEIEQPTLPTVESSAVASQQLVTTRVTTWTDAQLASGFALVREDTRFRDYSAFELPRRLPWLYPVDGCYTRALHANEILEEAGYPRPNTIWTFGNLVAKTKFHPTGTVAWSFHVAAVVQTPSGVYVLDPAIEGRHAIRLKDWIEAQRVAAGDEILANICSGYTARTDRECFHPTTSENAERYRADLDLFRSYIEKSYLSAEYQNLKSLGFDPDAWLETTGPWLELLGTN